MILIHRLRLRLIAPQWNIWDQEYRARGVYLKNVEEDLPNQFQGRSAFAVATSAKLVKDNFHGSPPLNLTEETKILHLAHQNNDGSISHREMEFPCMNSIVCSGTEATPSDSQCNGGKRKAQVILDAEDCGRCLKIDNSNYVLEDMNSKRFISSLCRSDDIYSLNGGKSSATELSDDSDTMNYKFHKKEKSRKQQQVGFQPSDQIDNHNEVYGHNETCFVSEAALPFLDAKGHALTWKNKSSIVVMNDRAAPVCLEKIIAEDYMKLLELDDDADEERYRAARERPLSPNLPELESPRRSHSEDDHRKCGAFGGRCETEKEKLVSMIETNGLNYHSASSSQDELDSCVIPEEINPGDTSEKINRASLLKSSSECCQLSLDRCVHVGSSSDTVVVVNQTSHALRTSHVSNSGLINLTKHNGGEPCTQGVSKHTNLVNILERKVATDKGNDSFIDKGAPQADTDLGNKSAMKMETANQMSLSKAKELICLNGANGHEYWGAHGCCVVFSNTKDEQVISRILCSRNSIMCDTSRSGEAGFSVAMVFHVLAANVDLSPEEKACILFSFLLCKVSAMIPADRAVYMVGDLSSVSELVTAEMDRVISDEETRSIFLATCLLDIFVSLIQDFLTSRKVMICDDTLCERSDLRTPDNVYHLDNGNGTWTLRTAAANQLVAGSVILASIISVHDRVDILWQTSFHLLRMCRGDSYWILTAVHVFASIYGEKLFSLTDHNLTVTAIKSLVLLLERGEESGGMTSNRDKGPKFSVCIECPFAEGEVCVDKVASWLLEELKTCIACATRHQDCNELVISSYNTLPACGRDTHAQFDGSSKEYHACCSLLNLVHQVDQNASSVFCHFTDIISLVELFGYYMGWECLHSKIIQQLFILLESCSSSTFSVSLIALVGRLGRIVVEAGGPDRRDVEGLMCSLSTFLDMDKTGKSGLPVQFAAVDALLNLLPLDFREIVGGLTSEVAHVEHMRRWFHQLGEEQKAVSLRLFQNSHVKKS